MRWYVSPRELHVLLANDLTQFEAHLPARQFRKYRCVGSVAAVALAAKEEANEGSEKDHGSVSHREVILGNEKVAVETAMATV